MSTNGVDSFLIFDRTGVIAEREASVGNVLVVEDSQPRVVLRSGGENEVMVLTSSAGVGPQGQPGRGIQSIARTAGNGAPGTTDTYTITLTDGSTSTFTVTHGAGAPYTNAVAMPVAVGGLAAGTTFDNVAITDLITGLLYPYQSPAFTSFTITGQAATVEVGAAVSGAKTFTWVSSNAGNVTAGTVKISDSGGDLITGQAATGSVSTNVGTNAPTSASSKTWTIRGTNSKGAFYTATFTVTWKWRSYYGTAAQTTLNQTQIKALGGSALADTQVGSTVSLGAGGYKYIALPSSWAAPTAFIDTSTNLDVAMATFSDDPAYDQSINGLNFALVSVTNANGAAQNYRVYRSRFTLAGAINVRTA